MHRQQSKGNGKGCFKGKSKSARKGKGRGRNPHGRRDSAADHFPPFTFQFLGDCRDFEPEVKAAATAHAVSVWIDRSRYDAAQMIVHVRTDDLSSYLSAKRAILSLLTADLQVAIPRRFSSTIQEAMFEIEKKARVSSILVDEVSSCVHVYGCTASEAEQAIRECLVVRLPTQDGICFALGSRVGSITNQSFLALSLRDEELFMTQIGHLDCGAVAASLDGRFLIAASGTKLAKYVIQGFDLVSTIEIGYQPFHIQCSTCYVFCAPKHGSNFAVVHLDTFSSVLRSTGSLACYPVCDVCTFSDQWLIAGGYDDGSQFHRFHFDGVSLSHRPFYLGGISGALISCQDMYLNFYCTQIHVYPVNAISIREIEPSRKYYNGPHPFVTSTIAMNGNRLLMAGRDKVCMWSVDDCRLLAAISLVNGLPNVVAFADGLLAIGRDIGTCHFRGPANNIELFDVSNAF